MIWPSERHGEGWWLQMSNVSKEEPGFDGSEGIGRRQEVCSQRRSEAKRSEAVGWIGVDGQS